MSETKNWNTRVIEEFRANGGKVGGNFEGAPILLLHTTGAKSGKERINPMMYQDLGDDRLAVFASKAGADTNPAWYHNLVAHPDCDLGGETFRAALVEEEAERARLWALADRVYLGFADYRARAGRAGRTIPILRLSPVAA